MRIVGKASDRLLGIEIVAEDVSLCSLPVGNIKQASSVSGELVPLCYGIRLYPAMFLGTSSGGLSASFRILLSVLLMAG